MIRVKTLRIEDFRGIRDLDMDLSSKNFGIFGPNGTGKSGVVDAIEFCLTGDVTRLSGEGTAGLSVKSHAPHVDQRAHPEKANVTITGDIPSLGKTVTIRRSVKYPNRVEIEPADQTVRNVVAELETHPEFALSRREIVKYIITPPCQRSVDVQTLLRLDHIERVRKSFTTFSNKRMSEADEAERNRAKAQTDLKNTLNLDRFDCTVVLEKVNVKRGILGLPGLTKLTEGTSFKLGVATPQVPDKKLVVRKAVAQADLSALQFDLTGGEPLSLAQARQSAISALEKLRDDDQALTLARRHSFIKVGLDLVTEDACPLCDTPWKVDELREHLRQKLLSADGIDQLLSQLRTSLNAVLEALSERIQAVERVIVYSKNLEPPVPHAEIATYLAGLLEMSEAVKAFLDDHSRVALALSAVTEPWWSPSATQHFQIDECQACVNALPDRTTEDNARDVLSVAQDRYERLWQAKKDARELSVRSEVGRKVLDHYNSSAKAVLEAIYDQVAEDFSTYYRAINREDEETFVGRLTSEPAKLSFDVDFYGRGLFPPGAYHSEGHQDAMGLCLYLALMKHTLGDKFTFAVLDDVLMSVDTGHRREVCRLLRKEFPNTQFILTTHDRVWLQYMKTEGLISRSQSFGGWTVDSGPRVWHDQDVWTEIQGTLAKDDMPRAAWLLRRYLEYTAVILVDNLRAQVEFRGDGHYEFADLMPPALKRWRKLLEEAEKSAIKWELTEKRPTLSSMRATAKELIAKTTIEQWAINPSVHFNEWANLQASEFQEVVDAFKALLEQLRCQNSVCGSYLYVSPRKGQAEELRCNCGTTVINLKS